MVPGVLCDDVRWRWSGEVNREPDWVSAGLCGPVRWAASRALPTTCHRVRTTTRDACHHLLQSIHTTPRRFHAIASSIEPSARYHALVFPIAIALEVGAIKDWKNHAVSTPGWATSMYWPRIPMEEPLGYLSNVVCTPYSVAYACANVYERLDPVG